LRPHELEDLPPRLAELVLVYQPSNLDGETLDATDDPAIGERLGLDALEHRDAADHLRGLPDDKARGVPELVGEVAITHDTVHRELDVVAGRAAGSQCEAQGVSAVLIHDL